MNEMYAEAGVKPRTTATDMIRKAGLIMLGVIAVILLPVVGNFFILFVAAAIVGIFYAYPRLNVEYEYIFCDGQFDFDKIMGGSKRKSMQKIDFEDIEIAAPANSHALDQYSHNIKKVYDYSGKMDNGRTYALIGKDGSDMIKILFDPSDKMLDCMKNKAPRKVVMV